MRLNLRGFNKTSFEMNLILLDYSILLQLLHGLYLYFSPAPRMYSAVKTQECWTASLIASSVCSERISDCSMPSCFTESSNFFATEPGHWSGHSPDLARPYEFDDADYGLMNACRSVFF